MVWTMTTGGKTKIAGTVYISGSNPAVSIAARSQEYGVTTHSVAKQNCGMVDGECVTMNIVRTRKNKEDELDLF
jgi:hypothetical protein